MKKLEEVFSDIAQKIVTFDDGDIFGLSELADEVILLGDFLKDSHSSELISRAVNILENIMKFPNKGFNRQELIQIIDDLQKNKGQVQSIIMEDNQNNIDDEEIIKIRNSEAFNIFIFEASEKLLNAQELVLILEKESDNYEVINTLFRVFHTIKGECGFLKIRILGELTHNIENLLDLLRDKELTVNKDVIDVLLQGIDLSTLILNEIKKGYKLKEDGYGVEEFSEIVKNLLKTSKDHIGETLVKNNKMSKEELENILNEQKSELYMRKLGEIALDKKIVSEKDINEALEMQKKKDTADTARTAKQNDPIIKVRVSKINYLVNMIGELLITTSQVNDNSHLFNQIRKITRAVQYAAMELRTEKVKNLFGNLRRVVRDLSIKLNKEVELEVIGEELEIDRDLIEKMEEPLMHLIRNSLDHGIERRESRESNGKDPVGHIRLSAERRGNNIVISIMDDGGGLNKDKIISKALSKNIVKKDAVDTMTDEQIYKLIFIQGFSTADSIDLVSGRGVGMDIVQSVISGLRGRIEVKSELGKYTRFSLYFPLNTAIIDGMIVRIGEEFLIIPVTNIIISIKIKQEDITSVKDSMKVIKFRDDVLPIIYLHDFFDINCDGNAGDIGIVVENADKEKYLFVVDEIIAKKEIVIKSLGKKFNRLRGISSGTVLSGGRVGLVMDVESIIEHNKDMGVICR